MASDPQNATGRTMPAQAPYAPRAAPAAAKFPKVTPPPASPSPPSAAPFSASSDLGLAEDKSVPAAIPASTAPTWTEMMPFDPPLSDRERAFVYQLRHVDQIISLGTLSVGDRAELAGTKVMLEHYSGEIERMLARKVSDLVGPLPELVAEPVSASSVTGAVASDRPQDSPGATSAPSSGVVPDDEGGSLKELLARLGEQLEQLSNRIDRKRR
jgi:hypothetical protein